MANSFRTRTGRCLVVDGTITLDSNGAGWLATVRETLTSAIPAWRRAAVVLFYAAAVAVVFFAVRVLPL